MNIPLSMLSEIYWGIPHLLAGFKCLTTDPYCKLNTSMYFLELTVKPALVNVQQVLLNLV